MDWLFVVLGYIFDKFKLNVVELYIGCCLLHVKLNVCIVCVLILVLMFFWR